MAVIIVRNMVEDVRKKFHAIWSSSYTMFVCREKKFLSLALYLVLMNLTMAITLLVLEKSFNNERRAK